MTTSTSTSRRPIRQPAAAVGTPGTSRSSGRRTAQGRRALGAREVDALLTHAIDAVTVTAEALQAPQALTGGETRIHQTVVESVVEAVEGCDRAALLMQDDHGLSVLNGSDPVARHLLDHEVTMGRGAALAAASHGSLWQDDDIRFCWDPRACDLPCGEGPMSSADPTATDPAPASPSMRPGGIAARASMACRLQAVGDATLVIALYTCSPDGFTDGARSQLASLRSALSLAVAAAAARQPGEDPNRELSGPFTAGQAVSR